MNEENTIRKMLGEEYEYFSNVSLGGKVAKLVAIKNDKITVFESIRHATDITTAIGQCLHYLGDSNRVFIVMLSKERDFISQSTIDILKQNGIGLIISDHKIEILIEAKEFSKDNISVIKDIKKKFIANTNHTEKDIKSHIVEVLKEHSDGLTISCVSRLTGRNRLTVSKYLAILEAEGIIECKKIGVSKIFKIKNGKNE
jgi:DNA-binding transcriptional ArsR family regulator